MKTLAVQFCNVSKHHQYRKTINDVSFTIKKGELTTLIGPNGAGKTTIVRMLLGLEQPSEGKIITSHNLKIGYIPQKLNLSTDLPLTSECVIKLIAPQINLDRLLHNQAIETKNASAIELKLLNFANVASLRYIDITRLSGGQLQKLFLAATLLNKPDLLVLDEPIQSLDVSGQQEFYELIKYFKQEEKLTIFMISHDLFTVVRNSDQVICLNGHICCSGRPTELNNNQEFLDALSAVGFYRHHHDHKH